MIENLIARARTLAIDTDHVVRQTDSVTQLLLRLGDDQSYPAEQHDQHQETLLVLEGQVVLELNSEVISLITGDQITIPAGVPHRFLPESEGSLTVLFEAASNPQRDS